MELYEDIPMSGYYHNLVQLGFKVSRGWHEDIAEQRPFRRGERKLVYHLAQAAELAGVIRLTSSGQTPDEECRFREYMIEKYAHDRTVAVHFGHAALLDFETSQGYSGDLTAEVDRYDSDNINTYEDLGFKQSEEVGPADKHMVMRRPGITSRLSRIARDEAETP